MEFIVFISIVYTLFALVLMCKVWLQTDNVKKIKNKYIDGNYSIHEILMLYFIGNIPEAYNALNKRVYNLISKCLTNMKYSYQISQFNVRIKRIIEKHRSIYKLLGKDMPENLANFNLEEYLKIKNLLA